MPWFQLTVELDADRADDVSAFLHEVGSAGVELREAGVKPIPGQRAAGEGRALLIAYFPALESAAEARAFLESQPGVELGQPTEVVEEDWSETWKARIRPVTTARLWVGPPWLQDQAPELTHVVIEPGMAFGTGDHPTTLFCLEFVDRAMAAHPGARVLDVGTGSGVLAIAAARLGAQTVVGVDNDPVAIDVARENARLNGTPQVELSTLPLQALSGTFDVVLANILANTLVELAEPICSRVGPKGSLALAGILVDQVEEVERAYLGQGLKRSQLESQGEWALLALRRP
jgi:ribosomal protein L11 methyltransferase